MGYLARVRTGETTSDLEDLLAGCLSALDAECEAVRHDLHRRGLAAPLRAEGGHEVDGNGSSLLYEWDLPPGRYLIRPDDAVRIACEAGESLGFVADHRIGARSVRVSASDWLGRHPGPAVLTFDPTWLLVALADRLRSLAEAPQTFHVPSALRLFGRLFPRTGSEDLRDGLSADLNLSQRQALARVLGSSVQFVWGPPGTGKTRLLGHAASALAAEGRVLVLAMTNVAVDEAAYRVAQRLGATAVAEGRVVRVGAEHSPTGDPSLSLEASVERAEIRSPGRLARTLGELEVDLIPRGVRRAAAPESLRARHARLQAMARRHGNADLSLRLGRLAGEFQRAAARALERADVVLTTFARLTVREELARHRFDSLIVDEASTAPLPHLLFASALASSRVVAVGDFQQLPAVVASRTPEARRWLSRDIFREAGIVDPAAGRDLPAPQDQLCSMLVEQYRMRPPIRALVSELFYGGRLVDADVIPTGSPPAPALGLIDTASLSPAVVREEGSRANPVHAEADLRLLELLAARGWSDVGLVTPYRLQARRLSGLVRSRLGRTAPGGLEVSTIHRFQGREKSVMVLDTVDAPPAGSWFLDERRNPDLPQLLNVALSRARDLLIVVGTSVGLRALLPASALLNRVVAQISEAGFVVEAARLGGTDLPEAPPVTPSSLWGGEE